MKKALDIIFSVLIIGALTLGLCTAFIAENEVNEYENRPTEKFVALSLQSFVDKSFQDGWEGALGDRVNFAQKMKKMYNDANSAFLQSMLEKTLPNGGAQYIKIGNVYLFDDCLVFGLGVYDYIEAATLKRAAEYNELISAHPEIEFYLYYIEKDTDISFETNEKLGLYELLESNVNLPDANKKAFSINSFEEFKQYFFKTDHHWNADGAYRGYVQLASLLGVTDELLPCKEKVKITDDFSGSKATGDAAGYSEPFYAYRYDFPEMKVWLNSNPYPDYGRRDEFLSGNTQKVDYASFYGPDEAEVILDTGNTERENILIIGESYDNAILKLIATHFNRTHAVDLRGYRLLYEKFSLADYIKTNNISKVVFLGNIDYIVLDTFVVED